MICLRLLHFPVILIVFICDSALKANIHIHINNIITSPLFRSKTFQFCAYGTFLYYTQQPRFGHIENIRIIYGE